MANTKVNIPATFMVKLLDYCHNSDDSYMDAIETAQFIAEQVSRYEGKQYSFIECTCYEDFRKTASISNELIKFGILNGYNVEYSEKLDKYSIDWRYNFD